MIEAGTVLQGRYRVEKQIGQGGMGAVFVATDLRFNSVVAIKETLFNDAAYVKAFEREARLLNSLRHPALPRVSDHFTEENGQFLVMEYITGEDLSERMERSGKAFSLTEVLNWANQLLDALEYLHTQDMPVIHRDIKPQNLKLTPKGQIVLLDFGLAKGNPTDANITAAKSVFGYSRNYASLEQIQGTGTDPRSDLYSLAATLYHLLTGIPPADALTRAMNVLNGQPDNLISADVIHNQVPHGVAEVLRRAMALNANERPQSAEEMRQMLLESDKNLGISGATTITDDPLKTDFLTQKTEIMSDAGKSRSLKQAGVVTNVNAENLVDETSVKTKVFDTGSNANATNVHIPAQKTESSNRRKAVGAAVLGALLLAGTAISAVYYYQPSQQTNSATEAEKNFTSGNVVSGNSEIVNADSANVSSANVEAVNSVTTVGVLRNNEKETTETASKPSNAARANPKENEEESPIVLEDDEEEGNVKIYSDRIETDEATIIGNKVILKNPPKYPMPDGNGKLPPLINMEKYRNLTPKQRQKLRQIINERNRRIGQEENPPPPAPNPSPNQ